MDEAFPALGAALSEAQHLLLGRYIEELLAYNSKVNLTAQSDPRHILLRHVADGLAAVPVLRSRLPGAPRILDLGAGAGFIGIAIKIAWPEAQVTLMEPAQRRYAFLNLAAARLGLGGLRLLRKSAGRDPLGPREAGFDAVVERALAPLPEALRIGLPLLSPEGLFAAYQSAPPDPREPALKRALERFSARLLESVPYRLPLEKRERCLALFGKWT